VTSHHGRRVTTAPAEQPDPGLASERTRLAWTRTAISFAALGAAVLRTSPMAGALVLAAAGLIWAIGRLASRSVRAGSGDRRRLLAMISGTVAALSVGATVLVLIGQLQPSVVGGTRRQGLSRRVTGRLPSHHGGTGPAPPMGEAARPVALYRLPCVHDGVQERERRPARGNPHIRQVG
jgi:uncharacterized membrane protein YidH (DUF202 family)